MKFYASEAMEISGMPQETIERYRRLMPLGHKVWVDFIGRVGRELADKAFFGGEASFDTTFSLWGCIK